jgi:competence protein ComEC
VALALAALSGAALGPLLPLPLWFALAAAGPLAGLVALRRGRRLATPLAAALLLVGAGALFGAWARSRAEARAALHPEHPPLSGVPVEVEAQVLVAPAPAGPGRSALLVATSAGARVQVEAPPRLTNGLLPGVRVRVLGRFARVAPPAPGRFDRAQALRRQGVAARLVAVQVRALEPGSGPAAFVAACARQGREVLERGARPRHAAFLRAVILGERGGLDPAAHAAFKRTGTAHLLSISGLHVSALAGLMLVVTRALGLRRLEQAAAAAACVLFYVAVAGAAVPTVRAAAAGIVAVALVGRGDAWNRLAVGLLAALAVEPLAVSEVGTVLSFGTVAGLFLLEPLARRALALGRGPDPLGGLRPARASIVTALTTGVVDRAARLAPASLAAFLASAPLVAVTLGQVPLASLALNPPCIALFSLILALGVAGVLAGAVSPPLGVALVSLADVPTGALFAIVEAGARLPDAPVVPPAPCVAVVAAGLLGLLAARRERGARSLVLAVVGVALALGLTLPRPGRAGAWLAPPAAPPPGLVALVPRGAIVVGGGGAALGLGVPPTALAGPGLDALGTRRVTWLTEHDATGRLRHATVTVLAPGRLVRVEGDGVRALLVVGDPRGLPLDDSARLRADVLVAPRASPALAAALLRASGARRALLRPDAASATGVACVSPGPDGAFRLSR